MSLDKELIMNRWTESFDYINHWDTLNDSELEKIISDKTISTLQEAVTLLEDESKVKTIVSRDNFVSLVHKMHQLCKRGSIELSKALVVAWDYEEIGDYKSAIQVCEGFVSSCKSQFYRDIARGYIRKYSKLL